jgi:hypothetical protein
MAAKKKDAVARLDDALYAVLRAPMHEHQASVVRKLLDGPNRERVIRLATDLGQYIGTNLPKVIEKRSGQSPPVFVEPVGWTLAASDEGA